MDGLLSPPIVNASGDCKSNWVRFCQLGSVCRLKTKPPPVGLVAPGSWRGEPSLILPNSLPSELRIDLDRAAMIRTFPLKVAVA